MTIHWFMPDKNISRGGIFIGQSDLIKTLRLKGIDIRLCNSSIAIVTTVFRYSLKHNQTSKDIIWIDGIWHLGFGAISLLWRSLRPNLNLIIMPHGMLSAGFEVEEFSLKKQIFKSIFVDFLLKRANLIIFQSVIERDVAEKYFQCSLKNSKTLGYGIPDNFLKRVLKRKRELDATHSHRVNVSIGSFLLFLGRVEKDKGVEKLIGAYKQYHGDAISEVLPLVIAGPFSQAMFDEVKRLAGAELFEGSIIMTGPVDLDKKLALYNDAAAVIVPSKSESYGLVLGEALVASRGVICTHRCGILEWIPGEMRSRLVISCSETLDISGALEEFRRQSCWVDSASVQQLCDVLGMKKFADRLISQLNDGDMLRWH